MILLRVMTFEPPYIIIIIIMGSPRKSKRLLQQQLEKREYTVKLRAAVSGRHSDGSDEGLSCREEETEVLGEQPLISVNTTPRTNNFIKV